MAGMCCGIVGEAEASPLQPKSRVSRRRRIESRQLKIIAEMAVGSTSENNGLKRQKLELGHLVTSPAREFDDAIDNCFLTHMPKDEHAEKGKVKVSESDLSSPATSACVPVGGAVDAVVMEGEVAKFGATSVCGRRRDMEDAVSIHPSFHAKGDKGLFHFYGVFDGHGCSHVATKCKERMHVIIKEEIKKEGSHNMQWKETMERSFARMDNEVTERPASDGSASSCRCELQTPQCNAVGSTAAVTVVTPDTIVVSNCGDSRSVLGRKGAAIPLSSDHKPDRPDELDRIEKAGGRVIYWDGPRVLGVLAMSRAIGDNYLKPYVIPEPEVTVTKRTEEDECLIIASDGLWDVMSNETACGVARKCLSAKRQASQPLSPGNETDADRAGESSDKACLDASILLTRLALARHSPDNVSVVVVDLRRDRS